MKMPTSPLILLCAFTIFTACSEPGQNDPAVRGERIHTVCLSCHSTSIYLPPRRKIQSLSELRKEVERWGDYYNPALSAQDTDDVTAYLNKHFYKFDET